MKRLLSGHTLPIYLIVYASFFDIHAQLPILALFAAAVGAYPFSIGMVVGVYSVFNIFGNGLGGSLIDRWGWRRPLLIGLVLVNIALYSYQLVESTFMLMLARSLNGLSGGILIPASLAALAPDSGASFKSEHNRKIGLFAFQSDWPHLPAHLLPVYSPVCSVSKPRTWE